MELEQCEGTEDFANYFNRFYCNGDRVWEWAKWAQRGSVVNTNMLLESFHGKLKTKYFNGHPNRRIDVLIFTLLEVARDDLRLYTITQERGLPANTYRLSKMYDRHRSMKEMKPENISFNIDTNIWTIQSQTDENTVYEVYRRVETCNCSMRCR